VFERDKHNNCSTVTIVGVKCFAGFVLSAARPDKDANRADDGQQQNNQDNVEIRAWHRCRQIKHGYYSAQRLLPNQTIFGRGNKLKTPKYQAMICVTESACRYHRRTRSRMIQFCRQASQANQ
jgi:Ni/Co efflux regulator RcnB